MTQPVTNLDPDQLECYSDHAHDIYSVGVCEFCGSTDPNVVGHILPHIRRIKGWDPVKASAYVVKHGTATFFDGILLDHFTASAIQAVVKALKPENVDRMRTMTLPRAADVCWKLLEKAKA